MRCRLLEMIAGAGLVGSLCGCAMVDHSNTMLFGTNTSVGVQAGVDSNNIPSVNIGYRRQEAVFLPLLANLKNDKGDFVPCPGNTPVTEQLAQSCKFLAKNGQGQAEDAYSVLASFGADIKAGTSNGGADASVGLAQYFATGTAAQLLALKGGAALVAVGEAAKLSALSQPSPTAVAALVGNKDVIAAAAAEVTTMAQKRNELADHLQQVSSADFQKALDDLSTKAGIPSFLRGTYCSNLGQTACVAKIRDPKFNAYIDDFYSAYKGS